MGNLKIEKINDIKVDTGFLRNYGYLEGGNLISQCSKTGDYRIFNATDGFPPDGKTVPNGGSDYYISSYVAEDSKWIRLEVRNVRNSNLWEMMCINGVWGSWELLPNNVQIQGKMDLKVDKVSGYALSKNDFNDAYKTKVEGMTNHFKGIFNTVTEINALTGCLKGDYVILKGSPDLLYYHNGTVFVNSGASLGGDMLSTIFDPTGIKGDLADRRTHHHEQAISTVTGLSDLINTKLNITDLPPIIDNLNSTSPKNSLSSNQGHVLQQSILGIISGANPIEFTGVFDTRGYIKLGNIILQYGLEDMGVGYDNVTKSINYPIPYPHKALFVISCAEASNTSNSGADTSACQLVDTTKFNLCKDYVKTSWSTKCQWFSIGF